MTLLLTAPAAEETIETTGGAAPTTRGTAVQ
jgi:hypothetical protein